MEQGEGDTREPIDERGSAEAPTAGDEEAHSDPNYIGVWGGLGVLTLLEVWAATLGFAKSVTILILVGLAVWKALLVALYYMHLRFEPKRLIVVAIAPLPLAVIFVMAVLMEF